MNKIKRFLKMFLYTFISKKTLITIIIILILLLCKNSVQAVTFEHDNVTYNYPDFTASDYYYISIDRNNLVFLWSIEGNQPDAYFMQENENFTWYVSIYNGTAKCYYFQNNTWVYQTSVVGDDRGQPISIPGLIIGSTFDLYSTQNYLQFAQNINVTPTPPEPDEPIEPYFTDSLLNLTNLNITNLVIDSGNQELLNDEIIFKLSTRPKGSSIGNTVYSTILSPSSEFYNSNGVNGAYYEIPVEVFKDLLTAGYELTYYLEWRLEETPAQRDNSEITVVYNPNAETVDDIELLNANLNSNFNKLNNTIINNFNNLSQQQQQMIVQQQEANDTAKDTNQFLKNGNFDNSNLNLPTSQGDDITQGGINNIFTLFYNAFTSGIAPDIIVPIPFTGKSFTIQANFLRNILNGTQFTFISNIIELFWWYIISKFIVQDIAKKMNKLKSGDLENLENSNIKEEML